MELAGIYGTTWIPFYGLAYGTDLPWTNVGTISAQKQQSGAVF